MNDLRLLAFNGPAAPEKVSFIGSNTCSLGRPIGTCTVALPVTDWTYTPPQQQQRHCDQPANNSSVIGRDFRIFRRLFRNEYGTP
jgi:hypothetical protein